MTSDAISGDHTGVRVNGRGSSLAKRRLLLAKILDGTEWNWKSFVLNAWIQSEFHQKIPEHRQFSPPGLMLGPPTGWVPRRPQCGLIAALRDAGPCPAWGCR